jgi:RNA methyltransferase, TrmH family
LTKNKDSLDKIVDGAGNIFVITENISKSLSVLDTPSGIVAVYKKTKKGLDLEKDVIYLNGVSDPGNLGTILRSALAFGLENIVLDEKCVDLYNPKTIQAAKDAIFKLNIVFDKEGNILEKIKANNFNIYVTNVDKGDNLCGAFKVKEKKCIILGSESQGVDVALEKVATKLINIKTTSSIESLNVAISAGIIFYELFKNLKENGVDHDK